MRGLAQSAADLGNYIADINRYHLPKPPAWWLQRMWDQDAALVVIPSRTRRVYLLTRRREMSLRVPFIQEKAIADSLRKHKGVAYSDSDMLLGHKLIGVDVISGNYSGNWPEWLLLELKDRDMWSAGGADAYIAKIEAQEEQVRLDKRAAFVDDIESRARDSWRSYQARTGQRNHTAKNAAVKKSSPSSRTAGSGRQVIASPVTPTGIVITG